ncbi:hypothetical protein [Sphingomonas crusticola]|uniref:hypothetical protein n=1 Tax=Sphingomonas crusticola TaxID=1697973 RepID=UPI000E280758|nr:hypothetical protein [Sphingomonas crusticola]
MKRSIPLRAALLACFAAMPASGRQLTPTTLQQMIGHDGAAFVDHRLSEPQFDHILDEAAKGDVRWLNVVAALYHGTDGARAEGISKALSDALQINPHAVFSLERADSRLPRPAWLCQDRAIEPRTADLTRFRERASRAVHAVNDPALRQYKQRCLAVLARS